MKEKLIRLVSKNAKLTNAQLAAMLAVSEEEVATCIAELEREGVIRGYHALVDADRAGMETVTALIELKVAPKLDLGFEDIARKIMTFPEVEAVYLMSGGFDLAVTVTASNFKEVALFVSHRLAPMDSVLSTATHFLLRKYKEEGVCFMDGDEDDRRSVSF